MRGFGPHSPLSTLGLSVVAIAAVALPAEAQGRSGKWEIEVHAGGVGATKSHGGIANLPGPGAPFSTASIFPPPAPQIVVTSTSRKESSWYFGDGALLFNQAAASVSANPVAMTGAFSARLVALDPVLGRSLGGPARGGSVGVRISRALTSRLEAETGIEYGLSHLQITSNNLNAIDATRASFVDAFNGLLGSNPGRTIKSITSTAAVEHGNAHELVGTGALIVNVRSAGRLVPYGTFGAAVTAIAGRLPSAALNGNYQFQNNASGVQIDESDNVLVHDNRARSSIAGILGAGIKYYVSSRWGVRLDARVSVGKDTTRTTLDATPHVVLGTQPAGRSTLNADPTIQFGNSTGPVTSLGVTAISPSTLSGPALSGIRTMTGTGLAAQMNVTGGVLRRF
jgi:hypothetical protein